MEASSDSESNDEQNRRSSRRHASNSGSEKELAVIEPLKDLVFRAVDFRDYRVGSQSARFDYSVTSRIQSTREKLDMQKKPHTFSGQDPISVLGLLARFRTVCSHNGVSKGPPDRYGVWRFP